MHWAKRRHTENPISGLPIDTGIQKEIEIGFSLRRIKIETSI